MMAPDRGSPSMIDFGEKLRQARERRGLSVSQISGRTKISTAALEALERNDVSKLPGGLFSRAFVRSYAREVGLDPDEAVREFIDRFDGTAGEPAPSPAIVSELDRNFIAQQHTAHVVLKAAVACVPVVALLAYLAFRSTPPAPGSNVPAPAATSGSNVPAAASTSGQVTATADSPAAAVPSPARSATTEAMTFDIQTSGDCWVRLTADGRTAFARLMHAGDKETRSISDTAVIEIGDAGTFTLAINGRPAKPLGRPGQVRTIRITKNTFGQYLQ
jgi:transcriptional regulator with XRE-family HTH domain